MRGISNLVRAGTRCKTGPFCPPPRTRPLTCGTPSLPDAAVRWESPKAYFRPACQLCVSRLGLGLRDGCPGCHVRHARHRMRDAGFSMVLPLPATIMAGVQHGERRSAVCGLRAVCCISGGKYSAPLTAPTSPCMQKTVARYSLGGAPMVEGGDVLAAPLRSPSYDDIVASTHILNFLSPAGRVSGAVQTPLGPHHASPPSPPPLPAPSASMNDRPKMRTDTNGQRCP